MLNWLLRYQPIIRMVDDLQPKSILDVGSGWHGLSWYRAGTVVQTDLLFEGMRPAGHAGRPLFVAASAEALPFPSRSFDVVVCSDLMEHLPTHLRSACVRELTRVARNAVIIGFPAGEAAAKADRFNARFLHRNRDLPVWLREHLEQEEWPTRQTLESALPVDWAITSELQHGNVVIGQALYALEMTPKVRRLASILERWGRDHPFPTWFDSGRTCRRIFKLQPVT